MPMRAWPLVFTVMLMASTPAGAGEPARRAGTAFPEGVPAVEARSVSMASQSVRHLVFTPSGYGAEPDRRWPLIVGLHGTAGRPEGVMGFQRLTELAERYGFLVVCPHSSGVGELHRRYVMRVLEETEAHYRVDPERIFLLGFSRGGAGVVQLAAEYPGRWAALAPISPAIRSRASEVEDLRHLPIILVVGDRDRAISVGTVRRWARRMEELGMRHQLVELPGLGHDLRRVNFLPLVFEFFRRSGARRSAD
ncbi:MAG: dienelactone hydrolase family protein [Acidobacteriota bacterium]